ncbi:MAG: hypothetical protein Q9195_002168 [Heterodermia aff. obscurata]
MANHQKSSPSVDEAISWLMDSMLAAGIVGFSDDYIAPNDALRNWKNPPSYEDPLEFPGNTLMLKRFLNESHAEEILMQERIATVNADKALRQQVKAEVHRRLLASGMSEKEIEKTIGKKALLTTMTKLLYERQNPKPKAIETVWCRVVTGLPGTVGLSPIRLPRNASLQDIYHSLQKFVRAELLCVSPNGMPKEELDNIMSAWRYQIITENDQGKVVLNDKRRILLENDEDCRRMIKKVTTSDPQTLFPLLTPTNPVISKPDVPTNPNTDEKSIQDGDCSSWSSEQGDANSTWDEWVQAEGFKPVDWKDVARRISRGEDIMNASFPEEWGI